LVRIQLGLVNYISPLFKSENLNNQENFITNF